METGRPFKVLLLLLVCVSIASIVCGAGVPNTLNYQGTLTDSTGKPVTALAKSITFSLYTSALGGTAFWTEPQTVPVSNGQFSAVLGSTVPLPADKFTGETYIGVTVDNGAEMLPRQKMTSVAYALKAPDEIPKGVIVMWSGAEDQIPEGWALCNGTNGTPNLRDRFVVGEGARFGNGKPRDVTGGKEDHVLTVDEMPNHSHELKIRTSNSAISDSVNADPVRASVGGSWSGAVHFTEYTGGSAPHNNLPPYYALVFIMKL